MDREMQIPTTELEEVFDEFLTKLEELKDEYTDCVDEYGDCIDSWRERATMVDYNVDVDDIEDYEQYCALVVEEVTSVLKGKIELLAERKKNLVAVSDALETYRQDEDSGTYMFSWRMEIEKGREERAEKRLKEIEQEIEKLNEEAARLQRV